VPDLPGREVRRTEGDDHRAPLTENGSKVRLRARASQGAARGAGDLVVVFQVQSDRFVSREGLDLVCEVPINLPQALLGTRLRVRTLDGKKIVLRVPAGTQPGRKFRIKGQGLEKGGRRGDQIVKIRVDLPEKLSTEQEALVKQLAADAGLTY
jgi:molecular chaperone DnaJ